jgi:hypothetical protein
MKSIKTFVTVAGLSMLVSGVQASESFPPQHLNDESTFVNEVIEVPTETNRISGYSQVIESNQLDLKAKEKYSLDNTRLIVLKPWYFEGQV